MTDFTISFSNLDPADKERFKLKLITYGGDIFTAATDIFDGHLRFQMGDAYVEVPTSDIFRFLFDLTRQVVAMNFYFPEGHIFDAHSRLYLRPHTFANDFEIVFSTKGGRVDFTYRALGEVHDSSREIAGDPLDFDVPLGAFNRAVWSAYDAAVTHLEDYLDDIDGFEERFCMIPFRGERYTENGWYIIVPPEDVD